jgi:hypothetical protein
MSTDNNYKNGGPLPPLKRASYLEKRRWCLKQLKFAIIKATKGHRNDRQPISKYSKDYARYPPVTEGQR